MPCGARTFLRQRSLATRGRPARSAPFIISRARDAPIEREQRANGSVTRKPPPIRLQVHTDRARDERGLFPKPLAEHFRSRAVEAAHRADRKDVMIGIRRLPGARDVRLLLHATESVRPGA